MAKQALLHVKLSKEKKSNISFSSEKEKTKFVEMAEKVAMAKLGSKSISALFRYLVQKEHDKLRN
jgi:hypothetical protein